MATSSATSTANQEAYSKLQTCVSKGYGIQVGLVQRDGVAYKRYVVPYDKDGNPIRTSELQRALDPANAGLEAVSIKKINDLAQSILDPHRDVHDTSEAKSRQNAFFDERGVHFVKSDEADDEDSVSHQKQSLTTAQLSTYSKAFGGIKDGMTVDQKAVIDLEAKLGSKTVQEMNRDEIDGALNQIDKKFVRLFRQHLAAASPTTTLKQVYEQALQIYVKGAVSTFQVSLNPTSLESVTKELNKTAHTKFDPIATDHKETWLEENVADLGKPDYAKALFQAIHEVGTKAIDPETHTQTTADHAYQALISKVNDCWLEAHRLTAIARVDVIDVPVDDPRAASLHASTSSHTGIHGSIDPVPSTKTVEAKTVLTKLDVGAKLSALDTKMERAAELLGDISNVSTGIILGRNPKYNEEIEAVIKKVADEFPDLRTQPEFTKYSAGKIPASEEQNVCSFLAMKQDDLKDQKKLVIAFHEDPLKFAEDLTALEKKRAEKVAQKEKAPTWRAVYLNSPTKASIQIEINALDKQIAQHKEVVAKWNTSKGKIELLTSLLHHDVSSVTVEPKHFASLREKLDQTHYSQNLSKEEIAALQTWQIVTPTGTSIDPSNVDGLLASLESYLDDVVAGDILQDVKREVETFVPNGAFDTWKESGQSLTHFQAASKLLNKPENTDSMGTVTKDQRLYALKLAHDSITPAVTDLKIWKQEMLKVLKAKEFESIDLELNKRAFGLPPNKELSALQSDGLYTTWLANRSDPLKQASQNYDDLYEYLTGAKEAANTPIEAIFAYLSLLPTIPVTMTDPAEKIAFLKDQAFQHRDYYKMKEAINGTILPNPFTPSAYGIQAAREWLKDTSKPINGAAKEVLYALGSAVTNPNQMSELEHDLRIFELEERVATLDPRGHTPSSEDLIAVENFLAGSSEGPITDLNQQKTIKQMLDSAPLESTSAQKAKHCQKQIAEKRFAQVIDEVVIGGWTPQAKHFKAAKEWLEGSSHNDPSMDVKKALASVRNSHDNSHNALVERLTYGVQLHILEEKGVPANVDSYNPIFADYQAVSNYLKGTLKRELNENELKAFKQMQTATTATFDAKNQYYNTNLTLRSRILLLETKANPGNVDTYNLKKEDIDALTGYLNGTTDIEPTGDTLKAFKKMQKESSPATMKDKIRDYSKENFQIKLITDNYKSLNWNDLWCHVKSLVDVSDIANPGPILKVEHEEAMRKFIAKQTFANDKERFLIQKLAKEANTKYGATTPESGKAVLLLFYLENTTPPV